jgi:hypothetical protein
MSKLHRFQVDLSSKEYESIEHLMTLAGLRTKKDLFCNALALFRWAANERLNDRAIAAIDTKGNQIREFEMPALAEIASQSPLVSIDELRRRTKESGRPLDEILDELERKE